MQKINPDPSVDAAEARAFLLATVALSTGVFSLSFWFGVFRTVFFENLFLIWVVATAALLASMLLPDVDVFPALKSKTGKAVLVLPSVWIAIEASGLITDVSPPPVDWLFDTLVALVVLLTFPYILYVLILVTVPDVAQLKQTRYRVALPAIVLLIAIAGLAIGQNHRRFVTCEDFKVSGDDVPVNCRSHPQLDWPLEPAGRG